VDIAKKQIQCKSRSDIDADVLSAGLTSPLDCHGGCVIVDGARYGQIFGICNEDPAGAGSCPDRFFLLGVDDLSGVFDVLNYPLDYP